MARARFYIDLEGSEVSLLLAEVSARVRELGIAEVERRIGVDIDQAFLRSLYEIGPAQSENGEIKVRISPTAEFDRVLLALW
jgi:hypothetical protein